MGKPARVPTSLGERTERPHAALLWLAASISFVAAFSARDLWAPDEPRYGQVAREMLERGDWLVPRLGGEPYAEKPPLAYWAMAATGLVTGDVGPVEARLFGALMTAVAALSLARLARRWFGDPALGDTAALLFATSALVLWNGSRAGLDLPLAAFGLLAVEAGTALVVRGSTPAALGFGAALGAGILTKGPHALLVPLSGVVGGCVAAGAGRRLLDLRWLLGLAVAAALVLGWLFPATAAGGEAYGSRLLGQLSDRVTGDSVPHENPVPYLWGLLLVAALPWTPAWPASAKAVVPLRTVPREHRFGVGASLAATLVPLVILSIPASKRDVYLLPLLPFPAAICAYALHRRPWGRPTRAALGAIAFLVGVGAFVAPFLGRGSRLASEVGLLSRVDAFALGGVGILCVLGGALALRAPTAVAAARAVGVAFAAAWIVVATAVLPALDDRKTHAEPAAIADRVAPRAPLVVSGFADRGVLWWYRGRALDSVHSKDPKADGEALAPRLRADAPPVVVLTKEKHWREAVERASPPAAATLRAARVLWSGPVGGTAFVLVTNPAPR
jgi:4-amino-4-deoxy-L-arabinose transferase-like glycosyltransferase